MNDNKTFDVIIIGGSYAGLAAAMSLGRALRHVLLIDSGKPCNDPTPRAHNFITHDGQTPSSIVAAARKEVAQYDTIKFYEGLAISARRVVEGFSVNTQIGDQFYTKKLIFATGLRDIMPDIGGFAACWGKSILHCPYCHGYEVRNQPTGILLNDALAFEMAKMISNWTQKLTVFTNGQSTLTDEQSQKLAHKNIGIVEKSVAGIEHKDGMLQQLVFTDGTILPLSAMYAKPSFEQHSAIPMALGCALNQQGLIAIDNMQKTTLPGIYACGDNSSLFRSLSLSVGTGSVAGAMVNRELIEEAF